MVIILINDSETFNMIMYQRIVKKERKKKQKEGKKKQKYTKQLVADEGGWLIGWLVAL